MSLEPFKERLTGIKSFNEALIWGGETNNFITGREADFQKKRSLTTKQAVIRRQCNETPFY